MKNTLLSKIEKLESKRRAHGERLFALYAAAYEKYHDVPDDQAPASWLRIKEIIRTAQERRNESQNTIRPA